VSEYIKSMKDSTGVLVNAAAQTSDFLSEPIDLSGCDRFGIVLDVASFGGTSPTCDITVEMTLDGGSTWLTTDPSDLNSGTQAGLTQITGAIETSEFWDRYLPRLKPGRNPGNYGSSASPVPLVRFKFDLGGTSPSLVVTNAYTILLDYDNRG